MDGSAARCSLCGSAHAREATCHGLRAGAPREAPPVAEGDKLVAREEGPGYGSIALARGNGEIGSRATTGTAEDPQRAAAPAKPPAGGSDAGGAAGELLNGRYRLEEILGEGGMGEVHRAIDLRMGRTVAVKKVRSLISKDPDTQRRFGAELDALARVEHPHVVAVIDRGTDHSGCPFLVMERLDGRTLKQALVAEGRFAASRAVRIADEILAALEQTHRRKIIHRDLKPSNVMLLAEGPHPDFVKILDFGIAKLGDAQDVTLDGQLVGTPAYMAPEALGRGDRRQLNHPRLDTYAVGVLLFEMLTARAPWEGASPSAVFRAQEAGGAPRVRERVPEVPAWLDDLVAHALAPGPAVRFQSAEEFRAALARQGRDVEIAEDVRDLGVGTVVDGKYRLDRRIGEGGTAVVYAAQDLGIGRGCAVKFLGVGDDQLGATTRQRFFRDAALAAKVDHPGVVRVFASGMWRGRAFIAMELVDGVPLREAWADLAWPALLAVLRQIGGALDAVHAAGIVHRDVSPENIVVDRHGRAKLLDFGIARDAASDLTRSMHGEVLGRAGYKSFEQTFLPRAVSAASDQWSLAAVVYEALTGFPPFCDDSLADPMATHERVSDRLATRTPVPRPEDANRTVPALVGDVVMKALAYDPGERFATVTDLVAALEATEASELMTAVGDQAAPARAATTGAPSAKHAQLEQKTWKVAPRGRQKGGFVVATLTLVVALGAAAVSASWHRRGGGASVVTEASGTTGAGAQLATRRDEGREALVDAGPLDHEQVADAGVVVAGVELEANVAGATAVVEGNTLVLPATLRRAAGTVLTLRVERAGFVAKSVTIEFGRAASPTVVTLAPARIVAHVTKPTSRDSAPSDDSPLYVEPTPRR